MYVYVSLFIIFSVLFSLVSRLGLKNSKYEKAYTVLWLSFFMIPAIVFFPFMGYKFTFSPSILLLVLAESVVFILSVYFRSLSFKYEEASRLAPIAATLNLFAIIFSVILFKSEITNNTIIGFIVILISTLIISLRGNKIALNKGELFALIASFIAGLGIAIDSKLVNSFSIPILVIITVSVQIIISQFIILRPKVNELKDELKNQGYLLPLSAILLSLSNLSLLKAFTLGNVPVVITIASFNTILISIAGIIFLKERSNIIRKIIAAIIATIGVIFVNL